MSLDECTIILTANLLKTNICINIKKNYLCNTKEIVHVRLIKAYGHFKTEQGRTLMWCSPVFLQTLLFIKTFDEAGTAFALHTYVSTLWLSLIVTIRL